MRASGGGGGGCQSKYRWEDENTTWDNAISTRADTAIWIKLMLNQTNLIRSTRWMNNSHAMNNIRVFFGLLFPWRKWTSISTIAIVSMAMLLKQCDVISIFFENQKQKKIEIISKTRFSCFLFCLWGLNKVHYYIVLIVLIKCKWVNLCGVASETTDIT